MWDIYIDSGRKKSGKSFLNANIFIITPIAAYIKNRLWTSDEIRWTSFEMYVKVNSIASVELGLSHRLNIYSYPNPSLSIPKGFKPA